ncbi:MAG: RNA-binding S4 domain-containing protein [Bacteroidales bacterium]|nr:RNA-binding S4 domain-containing protein [Bacteroidales bacterium]
MKDFPIHTPYIQLNQLLKASRLAESGGQARLFIDDGEVKVNGQIEHRVRAKLYPGTIVEFLGQKVKVVADENAGEEENPGTETSE